MFSLIIMLTFSNYQGAASSMLEIDNFHNLKSCEIARDKVIQQHSGTRYVTDVTGSCIEKD